MSDKIKDIVEYPHVVYQKYCQYWNFLLQSYEGGPDYTNSFINKYSIKDDNNFRVYVEGKLLTSTEISGNMFQHKKERTDDYNDRMRMSYYYNFCSPVIDIYTNHLFKQPIIEDFGNISDDIENVREDIDYKGSSIEEFRKQIGEMAQIYGHCAVLIDSPKIDESMIRSKKNQIDNRAYPYAMIYEPQCIINWSLDAFGNPYWVLLREYADTNSDPLLYDKNAKYRCKYRLWTRNDWVLYDYEYNIIDTSYHGLGVVPVVIVFNKKSKKYNNFLGISAIADISFIARDIYNSSSELKQILRDQTFAILALQGDSKDYDELTVGTSKAILYPPETNTPQYVSPQAENAKNYFDHIDRQISKIYQLAKLDSGGVSGNVSSPQGIADNQSGVSKAWDFNQTNSALSDKAGNLEDAENKIWRIFALWLGKEWDGNVQYPDEFSIQSLMQDLSEAEVVSRVGLGETFDLEIRKAIHKKKFPGAEQEDLDKMAQEAEEEISRKKKETAFDRVKLLTNRFTNAGNGGR